MKRQITSLIVFFVFFFGVIILSGVLNNFSVSVYLPEEDDGYSITAYDVDIVVNEDGSFDVSESIEVYFSVSVHGIYRYLPEVYTSTYYNAKGKLVEKNFSAEITNLKGSQIADEYSSNNYYYVVLGSASSYVPEGSTQTYTISYTYDIGDDRETSMDMIYYNIIGTGWNTSISNLTFSITFPKAVDTDVSFYVGKYGESLVNSSRIVVDNFDGITLEAHCSDTLTYGEAVTVFKALEEGYFNYSRNYLSDILLLVVSLITLGGVVVLFLTKRKKEPVVDVVEFKAPEGITPADAGYLNDGKVTGDDLSSLIVYWASKGYVFLEEEKKKIKIFKRATDAQIYGEMKEYERVLFNDLFDEKKSNVLKDENHQVYVYSNALGLGEDVGFRCKNSVIKENEKYFDKKADSLFLVVSIFGIVSILGLVFKSFYESCLMGWDLLIFVLLGLIPAVAVLFIPKLMKYKDKCSKIKFSFLLIVEIIALFAPLIALTFLTEAYIDAFFARFYVLLIPLCLILIYPNLERYTSEGRKALGQIRGLKNYILMAEKDMMNALAMEEPERFYEVLPYAYVLGVSDVYMKLIKDVKIQTPPWCRTDSDILVTVLILNSLMRPVAGEFHKNIANHNMARMSSNSGGGFGGSGGFGSGGGGFSGGGGGGGGGGTW